MSGTDAGLSRWRWIGIALLVLAALVLWLVLDSPQPGDGEPAAVTLTASPPAPDDREAIPPAGHASGVRRFERDWNEIMGGAREAAAEGETAVRVFVTALHAGLDALPHPERVGAVRAFFASGMDVSFGDRFQIGPGGFLVQWPSLRVALFDYLAQRDGAAAREVAAGFLATVPAEPGEWALALRELTRGRTHADWSPPVQARVRDFLARREWQEGAARAWLEGFDIVVAGRATPYLVELAALTAHSGPAGFAAFLAADRLMVADERAVLASLEAAPELFAASPQVRAGLYARADPRDPVQVERLARYLRRSDLREEEATHFAELFPFHASSEGPALLSVPDNRSMSEMIARDRAAVDALTTWMVGDSMLRWRPLLRRARDRIHGGLPPSTTALEKGK